jgi:hypothetical protein
MLFDHWSPPPPWRRRWQDARSSFRELLGQGAVLEFYYWIPEAARRVALSIRG